MKYFIYPEEHRERTWNRVTSWIWCPLDTIEVKKIRDGVTQRVTMQNSAGPNQHVEKCLRDGCSCEALEERMEEIIMGKENGECEKLRG